MSGIEDPGTPPELPEEYADTYRDAYLRALAETAPEPEAEPAEIPEPLIEEEDDGTTHWSSGAWMAILAVAVLLLIAAAFGLGKLLSSDDAPASGAKKSTASASAIAQPSPPGATRQTSPSEEPTEVSSTPHPEPGPPWDGAVTPVIPTSAEASCTARPGVDSANRPVTYDVDNSYDADPATAWRCDNRGVGQSITFTIPDGTEIGELGLVPGYAKTDPASGTDRYAENNRITRVQWTLADGVEIEQRLSPDPKNRTVQTIRVPRTATGTVKLEILAVQRGPRNTTAISSIEIGAAA